MATVAAAAASVQVVLVSVLRSRIDRRTALRQVIDEGIDLHFPKDDPCCVFYSPRAFDALDAINAVRGGSNRGMTFTLVSDTLETDPSRFVADFVDGSHAPHCCIVTTHDIFSQLRIPVPPLWDSLGVLGSRQMSVWRGRRVRGDWVRNEDDVIPFVLPT